MKNRTIFHLVTSLILSVGPISVCFSQDSDSDGYLIETKGLRISIEPKVDDPDPAADGVDDEWIKHPENLYVRFEELDAALEIGAASDRVRELQASLNRELRGRDIDLGQPVYVGAALGPDAKETDLRTGSDQQKVRIVFSKERQKAFVVRGNWTPLDANKDKIPFANEHTDDLALTKFVKMPKAPLGEPLKVDGVYGQHTEAAVALFQWQQRLPVTGKVDVVTLDKVDER